VELEESTKRWIMPLGCSRKPDESG